MTSYLQKRTARRVDHQHPAAWTDIQWRKILGMLNLNWMLPTGVGIQRKSMTTELYYRAQLEERPDPEREVLEDEAFEIVNMATSYPNTRKGLRNVQTGRNFFKQKEGG